MTLKLERTCWACPEQYDVFDAEGTIVGYLRLRHGNFTVECPNALEELVYQAYPKGDGIFDDDEREFYLTEAIKAIQKYYGLEETGIYKLNDAWKEEGL
jgi:hypothetical protein